MIPSLVEDTHANYFFFMGAYIARPRCRLKTRFARIKVKIGGQSTMCQVYTGAYVSLLAPAKTDYNACHPRKTTTYILHVVSITTHTHDRRKSIGKQKQRAKKKRKERKEKIQIRKRIIIIIL